MINLLPTDLKNDYRYARYNTRLLRWITGGVLGLVGAIVIVGGGMLYLHQSSTSYSKKVATAQASLQSQDVAGTESQLKSISGNTKLVIQVLSREILFSKLLRQLGASLPANTELKSFQVDKFQGGLTLSATAADINAATQLQLNLQDPKNKIFEKADIENISCTPGETKNRLPCAVQIRALFTKNNPYLYITPTGAAKTTEKKQ